MSNSELQAQVRALTSQIDEAFEDSEPCEEHGFAPSSIQGGSTILGFCKLLERIAGRDGESGCVPLMQTLFEEHEAKVKRWHELELFTVTKHQLNIEAEKAGIPTEFGSKFHSREQLEAGVEEQRVLDVTIRGLRAYLRTVIDDTVCDARRAAGME